MKLFGGRLPRILEKLKSIKDCLARMPRKSKIIIAAVLVALAACITAAAVVINAVKPPEPVSTPTRPTSGYESEVIPDGEEIDIGDRAHKADFFTVLVVGTDKEGWNTDTIMLAAFDITAGKLNILSIPRDTMVNVKRSNKKINAAFTVGGKGNVEELMDEVKSVTGIMADKYVLVDLDGFIEMIDAIGGVTVDVPINMVYNDPAQDLTINIPKGIQTLDGYDAMGFMRYRATYVEGDIGRIKVQQTFVKALVEKMLKPSTLSKLPKLCDIVMENVKTDFTTGNLIWLAKEALKMDPATDIETFMLPGEGGYYKRVSYYFLFKEQVLEMMNQHFNPYVTPIKKVNIIDPRGEVDKTEIPPAQEIPAETPQETPPEVPPAEEKPADQVPEDTGGEDVPADEAGDADEGEANAQEGVTEDAPADVPSDEPEQDEPEQDEPVQEPSGEELPADTPPAEEEAPAPEPAPEETPAEENADAAAPETSDAGAQEDEPAVPEDYYIS